MRVGDVELSGNQDIVVLWWTPSAAHMAAGLTRQQALDAFARVLARYPAPAGRFLNARSALGSLLEDGTVLPSRLPHGHTVALARPWAFPGAADAPTPALVGVELTERLLTPLLVHDSAGATAVGERLTQGRRGLVARTFVGARGVHLVENDAGRLAVGGERTDLEAHVDAALDADAPGRPRPIIRRRPQDEWLEELLGGSDH